MGAGAISQNDSAFVQRWTKAIWSLIILSAVVVRLPEIGRPFWLDEAWVVNSALTPSLRDSFRYDTWLQTSPPIFLIALRIAHKVFGGLEIPFRTIPFAFSAAAVLLALLLGKRLFGPVAGSFLGAVTAVSPILVSLSGQVKQYSSDLCCALLLMILIWDYFQDSTRGNYTRLLIAFLVCLPLAYTTVMFLPLAGIVLLAATTNHRTTIVRTALFTLLTSGMFLALEVLFIRPNQSPELLAYWYSQSAFPPRGNWSYKFYRDGFRDAFYMFYSRSGFLSRLFGVLGVCGFVSLLCSVRNARPRLLLALACLPILTVLALNRLLLYPFYAEKQDIIIFPCLAVLVLYGATKIAGLLTLSGRVEIILQTVLIGVCVALTMTASWFDFRNPPGLNSEDPASAILFLEHTANPGDLVYVHASAEEQIKLYLRLFDVHGMTVVFGNTGWPCCTRHHQFETGPVDDSYVMRDLKDQASKSRSGRILLVFADRTTEWEWLGRDERQIILRHVEDMSCHHFGSHLSGTMVIDDLRCAPGRTTGSDINMMPHS